MSALVALNMKIEPPYTMLSDIAVAFCPRQRFDFAGFQFLGASIVETFCQHIDKAGSANYFRILICDVLFKIISNPYCG